MKRLLLIVCTLLSTVGAWAAVTQPTLTTDANNPTYYIIQNVRSKKYANFADASSQLTQASDISLNTLWYFMANGDGVSIIPAAAPDLKLASTNSATAVGAVWYLPENPYKEGYFCVSLTSGATDNCWDDQDNIGYWQPSASDNEGTSWGLTEIPITKADVDGGNIAFIRLIYNLSGFSSLAGYTEKIAAVRNAADETALAAALEGFNTNITLQCYNGKYLVISDENASFVDAASEFNNYIQIESAGDGSFYLKGYKSEKYMGDVTISTQVTAMSDKESATKFYFPSYNGFTTVRPSNTAETYDAFRFLHCDGSSKCVGWSSDAENSHFTIQEVELPAAIVNVTYHLMVGGVDKAQVTAVCGVGDAPDAAGIFTYPYTTLLSYDVETITSTTKDVYVTAEFNTPFTASANFENATWHYATLRGKQMRADENFKDGEGRYQTNSINERTDVYKWAFIGDPVNNFSIINKGAGSGKYLYAGDVPVMQNATPASDDKARWIITPNSNGGFTVRSESGTTLYINDESKGGNIGYWDSSIGANDLGSNWIVEDITTSDKAVLNEAISDAQILVAAPGVPGYPSIDASSALSNAITAAQAVYDNPSGDYVSAFTTLTEAIATAKENIVYTPRTDVYYTITSVRGSMVYDPSHDEQVDADGNNFLWYTGALDNTDVNHLWGFIEQDGKYYMYNVGRKQFATVTTSGSYQYGDKGTWAFSDTPAFVTFDAGINNCVAIPNVRIRATVATTEITYSMSVSPSYTGPVITYDAENDGGIPMGLATSTVSVDADITAEMTAKVEDITPYREALKQVIDLCELIPFGTDLNQYTSNTTYTSALAAANEAYENESATKNDLQTAMNNLESAILGLSLNLPAAGFYRIKGKTSGNYLAAGLASNGKFAMSDATDGTTIFYFDGSKLTNFRSGMCNGMTSSAWDWVTGENASAVTFVDGLTLGGYAILSSNAYFYDNGDISQSADRGKDLTIENANSRYVSWYLEEVTELPVTFDNSVDGKYYTTLCLPYAAELTGATAFTLTRGNGNILDKSEGTATIAAGTPVLLESESNSATVALSGEKADPQSGTALTGAFAAKTIAGATDYVLGSDDSKAGFFHSEETVLKGFSAYLAGDESTSGIEAFYFDSIGLAGDVNGDGNVTIADVTALVNIILGKDDTEPYQYDHAAADVNGDGSVTIADVTALVNIILGKNN